MAVTITVLTCAARAETLYGFEGHCQSLTAADRAEPCEDVAYAARFPEDRIGLIFLGEDRIHVAFMWPDSAGQNDLSSETPFKAAVAEVGFVVLNEAEQIPARGACEIGKTPDNGTTFTCEAVTAKGRFAAQFATDGQKPKKMFGAPEPVQPQK